MPELAFKKATRTQVKLKLAITGPSGSGKTMGALYVAQGLGKRIAVIDTENGSASLYADRFEFDVIEMHAPFTTTKFIDALNAAVAAGYEVVIIDSISHEWQAEGGILDKKTQKDLRGGNQFTNWAEPSAEHEKFKSAMMQSPIHLVATMRSKTEYVMESNDKGKQMPKKIGLAPIQRDGMEYEFSVVFVDGLNHEAQVTKDRTSLFDGRHFKLSPEIGKEIHAWMMKGEKVAPPPPPAVRVVPPPTPISSEKREDALGALRQEEAPEAAPVGRPIPFGKCKGQQLSEISPHDLSWYLEAATKTVKANAKPEYLEQNKSWLAQVEAEAARRVMG